MSYEVGGSYRNPSDSLDSWLAGWDTVLSGDDPKLQLQAALFAETPWHQEHKIACVKHELLEKYPGLTFELVGDTMMCVNGSGILFRDSRTNTPAARSWDNIWADPEDDQFMLDVPGVGTYDTREGMTLRAYRNLAMTPRDAGVKLP